VAKRRGNHEGSISKRKRDGIVVGWMAQVMMPDGNRKTAYAKTQTEARAKLKDLQAESERMQHRNPTTYATIGEFLTDWLLVVEQTKEANTYRFYRQTITNYCQEIMPIPLEKLTPNHIQKLLAERMGDGLSGSTVRHVYTTLHVALEFGVKTGVFDYNIADRVTRPKKRRYEHSTITSTQVQDLLAATAEHRLAALFILAVSTGMRPGEILGLRWQDVDLSSGEIHIHRNLQHVDGKKESKEPKTEGGRRTILLTYTALNALIAHKQRQDEEKAILENEWDLSWGLVFCNQQGKPINATWLVKRVFKPALQRAGLPDIRLYDLRHTAATLLMEAGIHPKVVSEMLGHSSITLTLDTYTHVLPHMHAQAVDKMNTILSAGQEPVKHTKIG
jgi:integrase